MTLRVALYLIVAWLLAPVIAAAAGWRGIWGTGSAGLDFLLPLPISGGALHVPSWLLGAGLVVLRQSAGGTGARWGRIGALAMAASGAVLLVDMNDVALALGTDAPWPSVRRLLSANPLGLFLLVDGLLAALWPGAPRAAAPARRRMAGLGLAMVPPVLLAAALWQQAPVSRHDLLPGAALYGPSRGDETVALFTTLPMQPAVLAAAVARRGSPMPPDQDLNVQDQAIMFFDSHDAAQRLDVARARLTWCRYEDGTPERWIDGAGDCFSDHQNFSERLAAAHDNIAAGHTRPVHLFLARASVCRAQPSAEECAGLDRARDRLRASPDLNDLDRAALARTD
ncbi:MAG: hypothetical protein H6932_06410 [Burkholderiaceae bacterium]|nr:hypothetical protein [Burkholderiaceae bacterium]